MSSQAYSHLSKHVHEKFGDDWSLFPDIKRLKLFGALNLAKGVPLTNTHCTDFSWQSLPLLQFADPLFGSNQIYSLWFKSIIPINPRRLTTQSLIYTNN